MESVPDVERTRFAILMSSRTDNAFLRFTPVEPAGVTHRVAPPQTLYDALLSGAAACEAPQVGGSLQTVTADFTHGVIDEFCGQTHETSVQDDPGDIDSDDTSDEEDTEATAGRDLALKKVQFLTITQQCMSECAGCDSNMLHHDSN